MEDINIEFEDEPKKEEKHPADLFIEQHRKKMAERNKMLGDNKNSTEKIEEQFKNSRELSKEVQNDMTQDFREYLAKRRAELSGIDPDHTPNYNAMPQGLKEAQQRNGVRNHGYESGEFEWGDEEHTHVIWVPKEKGRWLVENPNEPNEATKDFINRHFDCAPYHGTTDKAVYHVTALDIVYANRINTNPTDFQNELMGTIDNDRVIMEVPIGYGKVIDNDSQPDLLDDFDVEFEQTKESDKIDDIPSAPKLYKEPVYTQGGINPVPEETTLPKSILAKALEQSEPQNSLFDYGKVKKPEQLIEEFHSQPVEYHVKDAKIYRIPKEGGLHQMKVWVGIDPGKAGAIVAVDEKGSICYKTSIPLIGSDVDAKGLYECLKFIADRYSMCVILEEVHSLHKMAASTNFSMGHTLGIITGIIVASSYKLVMVQPKTWQKELWVSSEIEYLPKKPEQAKPSIDTKLTSMKAAHRIFPNADFRKSDRAKKPNDGICDAALIAEYGRRKNL